LKESTPKSKYAKPQTNKAAPEIKERSNHIQREKGYLNAVPANPQSGRKQLRRERKAKNDASRHNRKKEERKNGSITYRPRQAQHDRTRNWSCVGYYCSKIEKI
jgi:hypothetical protein